MNREIVLASIGMLVLGSSAGAGGVPHVGDIGVAFVDGRIVTSLVEEGERPGLASRGSLGLPQRVFDSDLGSLEYGPYGNDEPGYTTNVLPVGAQVGFNIRSGLMRWNGGGFDGGVSESLQIAKFLGTPGELAAVSSTGFVPGFTFAVADSLGFFDEHMSNILRGAEAFRGFSDPADGVYALELELYTNAPGIAPSEPYWVVYNLNRDQSEQDAAIDYVESNFVPAPGPLAGGALLLGLAGIRRRR